MYQQVKSQLPPQMSAQQERFLKQVSQSLNGSYKSTNIKQVSQSLNGSMTHKSTNIKQVSTECTDI